MPQPRPPVEDDSDNEVLKGVGSGADTENVNDAQARPPNPQKPAPLYQSACPSLLKGEIQAKIIAPIIKGKCGERSPLALQAINIPTKTNFYSSPELGCNMATALVDWVGRLNEAAQIAFGSPVSVILSGNGYQCRRRNNLTDGKISEHGFANAIDITGFKIVNGEDVLVGRDWQIQSEGISKKALFLRKIHKSACQSFTTVLGPESNAQHRDHFHLDLGCHGEKCTYLLCE